MATKTERLEKTLAAWSDAGESARERVTNVLDVVSEAACPVEAGPLIIVARDILDAVADGELRCVASSENERVEDLMVKATDLVPKKLVSLLFMAVEVVPESDSVATGEVLEMLATHWTPAERREVTDWATAIHMRASDNPGVPVPNLPASLEPLLLAQSLRTSLRLARKAFVRHLARGASAALRALERQLGLLEMPDHVRFLRKAREIDADLGVLEGRAQ